MKAVKEIGFGKIAYIYCGNLLYYKHPLNINHNGVPSVKATATDRPPEAVHREVAKSLPDQTRVRVPPWPESRICPSAVPAP